MAMAGFFYEGKVIFCLNIVASRGWLDKNDLHLNLCCRALKKVNLLIISQLPLNLEEKWKCEIFLEEL